ncbi:GAF domain-containing protein [Pseudoalteromonas sp. H105]|jgi:putative methionine-R-sulfoxide reductase with GAF domain|uniref:GAF domain-containing protein n=1 Tax=Pseudoalteromonas sp. H105 TaxID=1348393 RepID=UPI0007320151|nr:GAF domain-containing protein [Pseudoalteromonas sp. H105]KTF15515.1 histidine kinase [Pseudoalteromonas sp. H105]
MVSSYLSLAQLNVPQQLVSLALTQLEDFLISSELPDVRWQYQIPELGEGGACSLFGYLQDEPFKLSDYIAQDAQSSNKLAQLQRIVDYVVEQTGVDWYGIYQATTTTEGLQLLKLAYFGAPSRPLFPLTDAFAAGSNNVQVALSGKGRVINNVEHYLAAGGEYYTCDPKVKSEACLPLFDEQNNCIGIVDGEAFNNDFFTDQTLALLIACCIKIPHFLV